MFKKTLIGLAMCSLSVVVSATPFSDGFENLSNWNRLGDVGLVDGFAALTTATIFADDDFPLPAGSANLSGSNPVEANIGAGGLEAFVGLPTGALDLSIAQQATEGSGLQRNFTVTAGEKLSFDWLLATRDAALGLDYAFIVIDGTMTRLASANAATAYFTEPYPNATGVQHFEYTFERSGNLSVAFGVVDVLDYSGSSALGIDNLAVTAVPEPASYALLMAGLGVVALAARRRRS